MPIGKSKNALYGCLLPLVGKRCQWRTVKGGGAGKNVKLLKTLQKYRAVGACIQCFEKGRLTDCYTAGYARLSPQKLEAGESTIFRTASIAKMVNALLIFRLQTLGKLDICEEAGELLGYRVRNPRFPDAPITLGMLLNHTSSIMDSPAYFASFANPGGLQTLLKDSAAFSPELPGLRFRYSNLGAGMIGCMLEKRFEESYERLMQRELFSPLGVEATFDLSSLKDKPLADSYRVLPAELCFSAAQRAQTARPLDCPDPDSHYLLASGNLFLTASALARLALAASGGEDGFINANCLKLMRAPTTRWPQQDVAMGHGMGLLELNDPAVYPEPIWGHQGFAYGAVNGVFFDAEGNGFASLNSGVSEQRTGHLAQLNRALIQALL